MEEGESSTGGSRIINLVDERGLLHGRGMFYILTQANACLIFRSLQLCSPLTGLVVDWYHNEPVTSVANDYLFRIN